MSRIIYPEDLLKIEYTCIKYPVGSYQAGEIIRLSGYLEEQGVDVIKILKKELKERNITEV